MAAEPTEAYEQLLELVAANRMALNLRDQRRSILNTAALKAQSAVRANGKQ